MSTVGAAYGVGFRKHTLEVQQLPWCTRYVGTREQLLATGIVKPEHFPGEPGNDMCSNSFYNGARVPKHGPYALSRPPKDENWLRVGLYGRLFEVRVGLCKDEADRRSAVEAGRKELARRRDMMRRDTSGNAPFVQQDFVPDTRLVGEYHNLCHRGQFSKDAGFLIFMSRVMFFEGKTPHESIHQHLTKG